MADGAIAANDVPALIGRHQVIALLASGGMSEIFLGRDASGRPVVIKRVLPHLARQRAFVTMFLDEARIGSLLRHRNVVDVFELGQVGSDLFMVMELLEGENASSLVRRAVGRGERLGYGLAAHLIAEACAGLHAAHELCDENGQPLGLVHRDVSPQNVFVTYAGDVKVLDFGIATASQRLTHTQTGTLKGKFAYMSPEQCRGERVDARSDIFSLGVVLYELCMQRRLFSRSNELLVLKAVCDDPLPRPSRDAPDFPPFLEDICMRALARDKDQRYPSAAAMRDDLIAATQILLGNIDPARALAAEMHRLFADRIASKGEMIRSVRAGTSPLEMPSTEVDENVVVPQATTAATATGTPMAISVSNATPLPVPRLRGRRLAAGIATLAIAAAAIALIAMRNSDGKRDAAADPAPAAAAPVVTAPPPPAPKPVTTDVIALPPPATVEEITIRVDSEPSNADVYVDEVLRGPTPIEIVLPAGDAKPLIEVRSRGFVTARKRVGTRRDAELSFTLKKKGESTAGGPRRGDGDGFHRFD